MMIEVVNIRLVYFVISRFIISMSSMLGVFFAMLYSFRFLLQNNDSFINSDNDFLYAFN